MLPRACSGHLYEVLDVTPDSSTEEIKRQYRRMALHLHPDRTNGTTTEQFQEVEEAHRILSDPEQRRLYDTLGREGLKKLGDCGVPNFLLTVRIIQPIIFSIAFLFGMLLLTLVLVALKMDGPKTTWSWAAVFAPVWVISPLFVLLGVVCIIAGGKACALEPFLVGVELLLLVVMPAVACAALQGRLHPPARAFAPFVLFYACDTLRGFYGLVPAVYAARRRESEDLLRGGDGSGTAADLDSNASGGSTSSSPRSVCRSRTYWREVAVQLLNLVCFTAFACLCYARAAQGPARPAEDSEMPQKYLSFFVVLSPLIIYYGLLVVADFVGAFANSGQQSRFRDVDEPVVVEDGEGRPTQQQQQQQRNAFGGEGDAGAGRRPQQQPFGATTRTAGGGLAGTGNEERTKRSLLSRLADALLAPFFHACCLYMVCMWATKMEIEYNHVDSTSLPMHPSVYAATFPLFIAFGLPVLFMCCLSCAVSAVLKRSMSATENGSDGDNDDGHAHEHGQPSSSLSSSSPSPTHGSLTARGAVQRAEWEAKTTATGVSVTGMATYNSTGTTRVQREDDLRATRNTLGLRQTTPGVGERGTADID